MEMEWAVAAAASGEGLSDGPGQLARTAGGGGNQQLPSQPPSPLSFHHKDDSLIGQNCLLAGGSELCGCSLLSAPLPSASPTGWHLRG